MARNILYMSEMARADLIYSENVYFIIQIQPSDGSNIHEKCKQNEKMAKSDMAFVVMIMFPGIYKNKFSLY